MDTAGIREELLTCEICDEVTFVNHRDFHILPCQHTLCSSCVSGLVRKRGSRHHALLCPWCRQPFDTGDNNKLTTFRYAEKLSRLMKFSPDHRADHGGGEQIHKPVCIAKLNLGETISDLKSCICCWGSNDTLYILDPSKPGLLGLNILSDRKLFRFGSEKCFYSNITFTSDRLYVFNTTQNYIEVYSAANACINSWCIFDTTWGGIFGCSYKVCKVSLSQFKEGIMTAAMFSTNKGGLHGMCKYYTNEGQTSDIFSDDLSMLDYGLSILWSKVLSTYNSSRWIISETDKDKVLSEIRAHYNTETKKAWFSDPIQHLKVSDNVEGCGFGEDKVLLFQADEPGVVRLINLSSDRATKKAERNRKKPITVAKGNVFLTTEGMTPINSICTSETGLVALLMGSNIAVYQSKQAKDIPYLVPLSSEVVPGPEYLTFREKIGRVKEQFWNQWDVMFKSFSGHVVGFLFTLIFTALLMTWLGRKNIAEHIFDLACDEGRLSQQTHGWKNFRITLCDDSVLRAPIKNCKPG